MATSSNDDLSLTSNQSSIPSANATNNVVLISNVPLESSPDEVCNSLKESGLLRVSDVRVVPDTSGGLALPPSKSHAIASVVGSKMPETVELQAGLPMCHVQHLFQELTTTEFILNPQYITTGLYGDIEKQTQKLCVNIVAAQGQHLVVRGNCCQLNKFREYLTSYLAQVVLCVPTQLPASSPQLVSSPPSSSYDATVSHEQIKGKSFTGLNPDILLLIPRLSEGRFKGMKFYPEEGVVEVLPSSEEEQEQCILQFQNTYQTILKNRQLKTGTIEVSSKFPSEQLVALLDEFNNKYSQCNFSFNEKEQCIKIVSISSRQFDQANKLISDRLSEVQGKLPGSTKSSKKQISTQLLAFETFSLGKGHRVMVKRGNIVAETADVVVNAANGQLKHIAGVAGALDKASQGELQKYSNVYMKHHHGEVPVGGVAVTKAGGNLKCKHVIHAVGPMASQASETMCGELIFQATSNALTEANKLNAKSICLPALSTGIFGVNRAIAANAMLQALQKFPYSGNKLKDIRIVILDEPTYQCFAEHIVSLKESPDKDNSKGNDAKSSTPTSSDGFKVEELVDTSTPPVNIPPVGTSVGTYAIGTSNGTSVGTFVGTSNDISVGTSVGTSNGTSVGSSVDPPPGFNDPITQQSSISYPQLPLTTPADSTTLVPLTAATSPATCDVTTSLPAGFGTGQSFLKTPTFVHQSGILMASVEKTGSGINSKVVAGNQMSSAIAHDKRLLLPDQITNPAAVSKKTLSAQETSSQVPPDTPPSSPSVTPPPPDHKSEENRGCPICLNSEMTDPVQTNCCKQLFCKCCLDKALQFSCYCPTCKTALRSIKGNQPPGIMTHRVTYQSLPGYGGCGTIVITYSIPDGVQGPEHPNPGRRFRGTTRTAYLPNNAEGISVLQLLRRAFDAGLIFTVGTSHTTHQSDVVVWNDIHHKTTTTHGGMFGYPDPSYFGRVKEELKAKGIQ